MAVVHLFVEPRQPPVGRVGVQLALASISVLDSREAQLGRRVKEGLVVPMSTQAAPARVDLPPGTYVVSVDLPSGEQLTRPLLVTGLEPGPIKLVLSARESPVARESARPRAVRVGRIVLDGADAPRRVRVRTTDSADSVAQASPEDATKRPVSTLSVGRRMARPPPREAALIESAPVPDERPRMMDVQASGLYYLGRMSGTFHVSNVRSWLTHLTQRANSGRRMPGARTESGQYVDVAALEGPDMGPRQGGDFREGAQREYVAQRYACSLFPDGRISGLAVVPWHWAARRDGHGHSPVSIFEDWDGMKRRWNLRLAINDGSTSSVLSYLTQGDLGNAQLLLKDSLAFLMSKAENPYAAAAGGYVLIHSKDDDIDHGDWPWWLRNLASWFPWLPDAQILLATLLLQRRRLADRIEPGLSERYERRISYARLLLERAMRAGIPIYSVGFRLLIENLEILSEMQRSRRPNAAEEGFPVRDALKVVRDLGSCITSVQPMTVLDLGELWISVP